MSVYKIFPLKDATIYSGKPTINAGRDEVLEISSINSSDAIGVTEGLDDIRRTLIQFSNEDINLIYSLVSGSQPYETRLKLYLAYASALPQDYTIECWPVSQSWVMGTGKFADSPNPKNGVSWYTVGGYGQSRIGIMYRVHMPICIQQEEEPGMQPIRPEHNPLAT